MIKTCLCNPAHSIEPELTIILSKRCNIWCNFCLERKNVKPNIIASSTGFPKLIDFLNTFSNYIKKPYNIHISGGEPLIPVFYESLLRELVNVITAHNNTFSISSNLTCPPKFIEHIQKFKNFKHFNVTYLSTNPDVNYSISRMNKEFYNNLSMNILLLDISRNNRFQITVCKKNLPDLDKTLTFLLHNFPPNFRIKIIPAESFGVEGTQGIFLNKTDLQSLKQLLNKYSSKKNIEYYRIDSGQTTLDKCTLSPNRLTIDVDGSIALCPYYRNSTNYNMDHLNSINISKSIEELMIEIQQIKTKMSINKHCAQKIHCGFGCMGIAEEEKEKYDGYDPLCKDRPKT